MQIFLFPRLDVLEAQRFVVFLHRQHAIAHRARIAVALERGHCFADREPGGVTREPGENRDAKTELLDIRGGHFAERTAAVVIETVQGEAGVRVPHPDYLPALRARCTAVGALLILDEIQCGYGRTGTMWAFEQFGIEPDILVCAKGMGGGMPIGAFIAATEIMSGFKTNPILGHCTTFGGHPVSCAAALATLQVMQDEQLAQGVAAKAAQFQARLVHPAIRSVRGCGLLMAVEFDSFAVLKPIIDYALEHEGVLTDWFLFCDNSLRLAPPLIITPDQIDEACAALLRAISACVR